MVVLEQEKKERAKDLTPRTRREQRPQRRGKEGRAGPGRRNLKPMRKNHNAEAVSVQRHAERPRKRARRGLALTTPDLVLLSLLAERPMHGYQANLELERREIRDWAGISRPQVYYSLEKLARAGMIRPLETDEPAAGPERSTFETTAKGRAALADALEREEWTTQRERPPFQTWIALSWQARPGVFEKQIERRRTFLEHELEREKEVRYSKKLAMLITRRCGW